jgi:hypothetical protein
MNAAFYGRRHFASRRESETIRVQIEESVFNRFHGTAVRGIDDVRVDVQRRCDARVPELFLRDLHLSLLKSLSGVSQAGWCPTRTAGDRGIVLERAPSAPVCTTSSRTR